jgi:HK97 family phage portal protein
MGLFDFLKSEKRGVDRSGFLGSVPQFGGANTGVAVDEDTALNFSAVWACVRVISETVASLPVMVYKEESDGDKLNDKSHPVYKLLSRQPNKIMTSYTFYEVLMSNLLINGNAYFIIERDGSQRPVALHYKHHEDVKVIKLEDEVYYECKGYDLPLQQDDVLHFMGLGYDGCKGKSPITIHRDSIGLSLGANITAASYFGNSNQVFGVLKHPSKIGKEAIERIRNSWNRSYGGVYNSNKTAILEEGMDFKPITIPASDRQLLESRRFQVEEICRIFRVPLHLVGQIDKSSYNSMEQLSIDFVRYTIRPYLFNIEAEMNRKLFRENEQDSTYVKFSADALLRGDTNARAEYYQKLMQVGVLSINEVRKMEDLNRIEKGDDHYMPLNFSSIDNNDQESAE